VITDLGVSGSAPPASPEEQPAPKRRLPPDLRRKALIALVIVWALVITAVVLFRGSGDQQPAAQPSAAPSPSEDAPLTVPEVYQALLPSVVRIEADETGNAEAIGTGFIANANGTVMTARHVVTGSKSIKLTYADGTTSAATIAGQDAKNDIAVLTPSKLPDTVVPAALGGNAQVGAAVVAIGNPLGLTDSTTSGVVSGLNRSVKDGGTGLIQFDAAVNPGNSGGPLVNDRGQVIGVVVSLANPTKAGTFIGIGFAVPIGTALGGGTGTGRVPPL
jgi:S1-C subfamily serine protease